MYRSSAIIAFMIDGNATAYALLAGALLPLCLIRVLRREFAWALFSVMINLALAVAASRLLDRAGGTVQLCAYYAACVAVLWSGCAAGLGRRVRAASARGSAAPNRDCLLAVSQVTAVTAGLASASVVLFMLCTRGIYAILEIWHGAPLAQSQAFRFGADGLVIITLLALASVIGLISRGDRRLITAVFWLAVLAAAWGALMFPVYRPLADGGFERPPAVLIVIAGLSAAVCVVVFWQSAWNQRARWRAARMNPDALVEGTVQWPGVRASTGAVGIGLILLVCYQLADPTSVRAVGIRVAALTSALCAGACGGALFSLLSARWSANVADIAMGLVTLAVANLALVLVPEEPIELGARFPMHFNAMMFALALMTFFWVWIGGVWRQQLDGGRAWTAAGRLSVSTGRFAFFVACMALAFGVLMSIWPRLRPVASTDDSLGRVAAAVSAHLLLVLVLLWSGRNLRRSSFRTLTALVVVSLVSYIVVRAAPLSSRTVAGPKASGAAALRVDAQAV